MKLRDWRLWLAGLVSIAISGLLALPDGRLGATTAQREEALTPAPDFDICQMLHDFLSDRSGDLPALTRVDDPAVDETVAIRHPHRSRRSCDLGENDSEFGPDHIRLTDVSMTVTTMGSHQSALDRLLTLVSRTDLGQGALISIEDDRATLAGFLAEDHGSWQVLEHYVIGPHHVVFFVRFHEDDEPIDGPEVVKAIDKIVDARLDPDDFLMP